MTIPTCRLFPEDLRRLAAGPDPSLSQILIRAQYAKNVLLLRFVLDRLPSGISDARAILLAACAADGQAFQEYLVEPMVSAWLSRTAALLDADAQVPDIAQAAAVAAVAAARCRMDVDVAVTPVNGRVCLPTLGVARGGTATVARVEQGAVIVDDSRHWQEVRALIDGPQSRPLISLDDLDPGRDMYGVPPAGRVGDEAFGAWRSTAKAAWRLLTEHAPASAAELAGGIRVTVPLADTGTGESLSITTRRAFGAFGLTWHDSPVKFAVALVHEYQHSKLNAVLDVTPIHDGTDTGQYFAPWREDARPLHGLLHGTYAFLGIGRCWDRLREVPGLEQAAARRLAEVRLWVAAGLEQVEHSAALTEAGQAFAGGLRQGLDELFEAELPAAAVTAGRRSLRRLRQTWELRNKR